MNTTKLVKVFSIYLVEKGLSSVRVLAKNKNDAIQSSGLQQNDAVDILPSVSILKKHVPVKFIIDEDNFGHIQDYECEYGFGNISEEVEMHFAQKI